MSHKWLVVGRDALRHMLILMMQLDPGNIFMLNVSLCLLLLSCSLLLYLWSNIGTFIEATSRVEQSAFMNWSVYVCALYSKYSFIPYHEQLGTRTHPLQQDNERERGRLILKMMSNIFIQARIMTILGSHSFPSHICRPTRCQNCSTRSTIAFGH